MAKVSGGEKRKGKKGKRKRKRESFRGPPHPGKQNSRVRPAKTIPRHDWHVWAPATALTELGQPHAPASAAAKRQVSQTRLLRGAAPQTRPAHTLGGSATHDFQRGQDLSKKPPAPLKGVRLVHLIANTLQGKRVRPTPHAGTRVSRISYVCRDDDRVHGDPHTSHSRRPLQRPRKEVGHRAAP